MGLGKTLQSITILAHLFETNKLRGPHLVLVPKSTLSNWGLEFKRWCPIMKILKFHGNREEREEIANNSLILKDKKMYYSSGNPFDWDVLITTYEILNLEKNLLSKINWNYLIIDEAHRLKNEESNFSKIVRQLNTKHRLLLTGTPLQNNLHELWALLNFLIPEIFQNSSEFDDFFNLEIDNQEEKENLIKQLHKILNPFMLRRLKVDVEKSLPPKNEILLYVHMSEMQRNLYKQVLSRNIETINTAFNQLSKEEENLEKKRRKIQEKMATEGPENEAENVSALNSVATSSSSASSSSRNVILNLVMQLRKCCNHPYLFEGIEDRSLNPYGDHLYKNCGKMFLLHKLMIKLKEKGHRILIFTQMTRMLDIIEDYLLSMNYNYCRIDGNTTYNDREDRIYEFNKENSDKFCFILSTRAGGLGINLQTADTVIIYDSDWNPQADLQAQDRAHRIGQKKPVMVYRLVTEDSVEVKIIERAQQKLKLDAMIVQQGRLLNNADTKKISKDKLLETLKFGADKIFRKQENHEISDQDIETIIEEGLKRTKELQNNILEEANKGDLYDFKLDGNGLGVQIFEGKDYSDRKNHDKSGLTALNELIISDMGKRDRRAVVQSYNESAMLNEGNISSNLPGSLDNKFKFPRHLKLPKMEDFQFYNKARLLELHAEENKLFEKYLENYDEKLAQYHQAKENLNNGEGTEQDEELINNFTTLTASALSKLTLLPDEKMQEKHRLLSEGFSQFTRIHYLNFIKASAKYGRKSYDKISQELNFPYDLVKKYSETFWERGPIDLPPQEWEKVLKQIEKGEKKLEEIDRLTIACKNFIKLFKNPWENLSFKYIGNASRAFTNIEDRYLLNLVNLYGYGKWDEIRNFIRKSEKFRYNFYLQSCSSEAIGKRCEALMRLTEKELIEMEKKKSSISGATATTFQEEISLLPNSSPQFINNFISNESLYQQRITDLNKQINEETKKFLHNRAEFLKSRSDTSAVSSSSSLANSSSNSQLLSSFHANNKDLIENSLENIQNNIKNSGKATGRFNVTALNEYHYPELCHIISVAGPDGVSKIIDKFLEKFPTFSKRQIEIKINEVSVKEKREENTMKVWHIKDEYLKYLDIYKENQLKLNQNKENIQTDENQIKDEDEKVDEKNVEDKMEEADNEERSNKRKLESEESSTNLINFNLPPPPLLKNYRAFALFCSNKKKFLEDEILKSAIKPSEVKDLLVKMWESLDSESKKAYEQEERELKRKYDKELSEWNELVRNNKRIKKAE